MRKLDQFWKLAGLVSACNLAIAAWADTEIPDSIEEVHVIGQRAMAESALLMQRGSDVIESAITRDAIGQFPDQNVAEAVRRLAGVNVLDDQGEGRFIAVRGLDPSLNAASLNGTRLPAPESDTRSVALDVIPSELVESIEVKKTLTPDMDADTIGASIRINTTSAFNRKQPFLSLKAENSYNDLNEKNSPKASIDFVYPINERFGVSGGASYNKRKTSTDNTEMDGWSKTDSGIVFADELQYRDYDVERKRAGGSLSFDFQPSDSTKLSLKALYSLFDDTEKRARLTFDLSEEPSSGDANTASFISDDGRIRVIRDLKDRFESQKIRSYEFGGETAAGYWNFDYKVAFSKAEEHEYRTQDPTRFREDFKSPGELAVTFDYSNLHTTTYDITTGKAAFLDPSGYSFNKIDETDGLTQDKELAYQFDAARDITTSNSDIQIKFGAKLRQRDKFYDVAANDLDDFSGSYTLADVLGTQSYDLALIEPLPDLGRVRNFFGSNAASFEVNALDSAVDSNADNYEIDEDITAGYLMGRWDTGLLTVIGGVRMERTSDSLDGNLLELVEEGGIHNGMVLTDDTLFITPNHFSNDYTDWLPSISLKYAANDDVVVRAGVFKSVVRPNFSDMAPRFSVEEADDGEREGEFGNPQLDPYRAWNLDVSTEWYFDNGSVIQGGAFYKRIDDFIVSQNFEATDAPYLGTYNGISFDEAAIPLNGDEATVKGLEFNYQQTLTFLQAPFDGILLGFNYTWTDTEGKINGRTIPLPAASEHNYNALLGYESGPISLRLTAAYRDDYLDELGGSAEKDRYVKDHLQWDFSASYRVLSQVRLYAQLVNINDEPYIAYQRGPGRDRLLQYETYSWTGKFGVTATF